MSKIIPQITFSDYGEIEILGDLERFLLALLGMDDESLMRKLEVRRGNGRNDYPIRVMWNLIICHATRKSNAIRMSCDIFKSGFFAENDSQYPAQILLSRTVTRYYPEICMSRDIFRFL